MRQLNTIIDSREYNDNNNKNREKKLKIFFYIRDGGSERMMMNTKIQLTENILFLFMIKAFRCDAQER